jgi:serine protease Do
MLNAMASALPGIAQDTAALVARLRPSVVVVRNGHQGAGSGIIWDSEGLVVTNHHVAPSDGAEVVLPDGRVLNGRVERRDRDNDLAVLRVAARGLPAVSAGDSRQLKPGDLVFAVGNPLGLPGAVSAGIVTSTPLSRGGGRKLIHADVSLAPGNSGGPLVTAAGQVVGVNSMMRMPGLALAVPSEAVVALLEGRESGTGYLGLNLLQIPLPAAWISPSTGDTGFLVTGVLENSPAEKAGVLVGDIVIGSDGDATAPASSLTEQLQGLRAGDGLNLLVLRAGQAQEIRVMATRRLPTAA